MGLSMSRGGLFESVPISLKAYAAYLAATVGFNHLYLWIPVSVFSGLSCLFLEGYLLIEVDYAIVLCSFEDGLF